MNVFTEIVNYCINEGVKHNTTTLSKLTKISYHKLSKYELATTYKINAISRACGVLKKYKKDLKEGKKPKIPLVKNKFLTNCYGIKINGCLLSIPYKPHQQINILLNHHTQKVLSDPTLKVRSFTLTAFNISLCISKDVPQMECTKTVGIDRNLRNVTVGNLDQVIVYKTNKLLSIKENTIHARAGFKRNDQRVKKRFWQIKNQRMQNRTKQYLHKISKNIVENAKSSKSTIVLENLKGIRKLYRKGNGQGNKYRRKLNGWPFYELQRQIQYKAAWEGIPVKLVDPKRTSKLCPICGLRVQEDRQNSRKLWCNNCKKSMDRDVVASLNISYKGWARFNHPRGDTNEAQSGTFEPAMSESKLSNYDDLVIRIVDVSKSSLTQPRKPCETAQAIQ